MAQKELEVRLRTMEVRLQTMEDIEAIKKLQSAYCYYLEHWQTEEVVGLWSHSPDVSLEINESGLYKGWEKVTGYFSFSGHFYTRDAKAPPEFLHLSLAIAGIVDVDSDGKTAKGRWYGFSCRSLPTGEKVLATFGSGIWENEYVKEDGKWKFKKLFYNNIFVTPYEDGWVKTPYLRRISASQDKPPAPGPNTHFAPYPSGYIFPYHYKNPVTGK